jgi:hypothetical protein
VLQYRNRAAEGRLEDAHAGHDDAEGGRP